LALDAVFSWLPPKKRGWKVKGIEPSIQSAEVAKRQYGLDIYNGTLQEYDENGEIADSGENCHLFRK
jgi:hypothetical protein